MAAGELWDSTGGHDPHDVLSAPQRDALDLAAAVHRASPGQETGCSEHGTRPLPVPGPLPDTSDLTTASCPDQGVT